MRALEAQRIPIRCLKGGFRRVLRGPAKPSKGLGVEKGGGSVRALKGFLKGVFLRPTMSEGFRVLYKGSLRFVEGVLRVGTQRLQYPLIRDYFFGIFLN